MNRWTSAHRRLRRMILARRRSLSAVLAGSAVLVGFQAATDPPPTTVPVLTAARDLPGGVVVSRDDLALVGFTPASVPEGVVATADEVVGRTTTTPFRAGEPVTDVRLVHGSVLDGYPGSVAVPVRIGDPGAVGMLRVGDRIDVLAADPQRPGPARVVADDMPVLALPRADDPGGSLVSGALVVLAVPPSTAAALAGAGVAEYLSVVVNP
jgi:Flp pilus assembly protein CpaB